MISQVNTTIDWKFVLAVGGSVGFIMLVAKLDPASARMVLIHTADSVKELVVA